jgi:uncharacterized protein YbaR (Trm112 family)
MSSGPENDPGNLMEFEQWARELVCPACLGELRFGADAVVCKACGRKYPVVDGIPVLIVERAETPRA